MRLIRFGTFDLPPDEATDSLSLTGRSNLLELPGGDFDADGAAFVARPRQLVRDCFFTETSTASIQEQVDTFLVEVALGWRLQVAETRDVGFSR